METDRRAVPAACFAWEVQDLPAGDGGLGPCGVSRSKPSALRALSEALLSAGPGAVGEIWRARPSQTRPAVFVYEGLVARVARDDLTPSIVWR
ncbi:hypothetical protein ACFQU9_09790 [Actinomadura namibiensis]|uniref:Uncharacterized protein n=1 Tax=Actinomadura namibiensis TaxID=182080 RepID=A0A7W3LVF4_ACTNM|nr:MULTISPECIES: hypothetical protein [Actinomadura]MBA8954984.1 hypothetical protein [Actinomadura namibiensis]